MSDLFLEFDEMYDLEDAARAERRAQRDMARGDYASASREMRRARNDIADAQFDEFLDNIF